MASRFSVAKTASSTYSVSKSSASVSRSSASVSGEPRRKKNADSPYDPGSDYFARIAVLGDSAVGKSTLIEMEVAGKVDTGPAVEQLLKGTGISFRTKRYRNMEYWCTMQYWDAPGDPAYARETARYCAGAAGYVLVFDVNRPETLENIEKIWIPELWKGKRGGRSKSLLGAEGSRERDVRDSPRLGSRSSEDCAADRCFGDSVDSEIEDAAASGHPPMIIVGNKADADSADATEMTMAGLGKPHRVYMEEATMFAERFHAEYFEVSALAGTGVADAFTHITMEIAKLIPDPPNFSKLLAKGITPVRPLAGTAGVMLRQAMQMMLAEREDITATVDWL